ncbi:tripartite tricarboxylate transporter substrate binding protein [Orrella sp. NBD-18]|uniref:Tripartite tricarboxylate transporter substrate binding protein n=1 Tax=Sheuella amnicola TaxID=2707330 RepID=A0A6B2QWH1_9BURK|nr:tripartite tricarboxylate transporter substrate binding protein [Sheuella amnicola]NDY82352.1 tripartite tricarboxylate transporter substrate binding protein [Sheuella amnicola]
MKYLNHLVKAGLVTVMALLYALPVAAQGQTASTASQTSDWPTKGITLISPYAAGGFSDTRMRLLARKLSEKLGQPVVVENKSGAGGVIGTAVIAKAAPDGYTIGSGNLAPLAVNQSLMKKLPYDPAKDIEPVILVENSPLILSVANNLPVKNLAELIALAKKEPGKLTFGSSGIGGAHHLSGEMFRELSGIQIVHVPYKGGSPAATDLMAGHLSMMFEMGYAALPSIRADRVRPIAVSSNKRLAILPDVPTMAEAGVPGFESYNWQGIIVPAGTPVEITTKLNKVLNEVLLDPEVQRAIIESGGQPGSGSAEDFGRFITAERAKWSKVIQQAQIKAE